MSDEWGPWIEHDGKGCPVVGQWVHRVTDVPGMDRDGVMKSEKIGIVRNANSGSWWWRPGYAFVIRYRVRRPRGLTILENIVASLDAPEGPIKAPSKVEAQA